MSLEERFYIGFYLTVLNALLPTVEVDRAKFHGYGELIEVRRVPEKYRFDLTSWDFLIVVGELPEELPEPVRRRLKGCE